MNITTLSRFIVRMTFLVAAVLGLIGCESEEIPHYDWRQRHSDSPPGVIDTADGRLVAVQAKEPGKWLFIPMTVKAITDGWVANRWSNGSLEFTADGWDWRVTSSDGGFEYHVERHRDPPQSHIESIAVTGLIMGILGLTMGFGLAVRPSTVIVEQERGLKKERAAVARYAEELDEEREALKRKVAAALSKLESQNKAHLRSEVLTATAKARTEARNEWFATARAMMTTTEAPLSVQTLRGEELTAVFHVFSGGRVRLDWDLGKLNGMFRVEAAIDGHLALAELATHGQFWFPALTTGIHAFSVQVFERAAWDGTWRLIRAEDVACRLAATQPAPATEVDRVAEVERQLAQEQRLNDLLAAKSAEVRERAKAENWSAERLELALQRIEGYVVSAI